MVESNFQVVFICVSIISSPISGENWEVLASLWGLKDPISWHPGDVHPWPSSSLPGSLSTKLSSAPCTPLKAAFLPLQISQPLLACCRGDPPPPPICLNHFWGGIRTQMISIKGNNVINASHNGFVENSSYQINVMTNVECLVNGGSCSGCHMRSLTTGTD